MDSKIKTAVELVQIAEELITQYDLAIETNSTNKDFIVGGMVKCRREMLDCLGITASEMFANKFSYLLNNLSETLFMEGKINIPY